MPSVHTQTQPFPFPPLPNLRHIFLCSRGTNAETRRRICAPTGNWGKNNTTRIPETIAPPFYLHRAPNLFLNLTYSSVMHPLGVMQARLTMKTKMNVTSAASVYVPVVYNLLLCGEITDAMWFTIPMMSIFGINL